jgi:hypothetical protein
MNIFLRFAHFQIVSSCFALQHKPFNFMTPLISSTHKLTEGRAPVWGSEFTTKVATLQGVSADLAARLNVEL